MMKFKLTIFTLFTFFQANSQISFTEKYFEYNSASYNTEVIHGDFNGDGVADIVMTEPNGKKLKVGLNNNLQKPVFVNIETTLDIRNIAVHDFDQDGDEDIFGAAIFNDQAYCWTNDGAGVFTKVLLSVPDYSSIAFADMTGDGVDEMLLGVELKKLNIYDITGGVITLKKTVSNDSFLGAPDAMAPVDYNNDGVMDIAGGFYGDGIIVFQQSSNLNFTEININPVIFGISRLAISDINGDSVKDFLTFRQSYNTSTILKSQAVGGFEQITLPFLNGVSGFTTFGDINNDSISDILYSVDQSSTTGRVSLYLSGNDTLTPMVIDSNYAKLGGGIGDLDGDGDMDIYFYANDFFDEGLVYYINNTPVDHDNDGYANDVDCDDQNPDVYPGAVEIPYNGVNEDCSNLTPDDDLDQDGYLLATDCNDADSAIYPGAVEIVNNGIDEDCDGMDLTSSTHELSNTRIYIYPNPASEQIYLRIPPVLQYSVKLFDSTGRLNFQGTNSAVINLSNQNTGIYFLEVTDVASGQYISEKVMVVK